MNIQHTCLEFRYYETYHLKEITISTTFKDNILNKTTVSTFMDKYIEQFPAGINDSIYQEIKQARFVNNRFHFLNLFYKKSLKTLLDYLPEKFAILYYDNLSQIF